ncbi:MAG: GumC family protein [Acidobacteriaceae bacterium]
MLGHRTLTPEDYLAILKRRAWIIAIPAIILPIVAYAITFFVQPQYVSQTLVLIEQQKVPDNYVKPIVTEDLNARLATMKEQILSRSRLLPIIERFGLYGNTKMVMDDRITQVRKMIDIKPIHSDVTQTGGLPGFYISYQANDPRTAQLVCGEITSLFVSTNLHAQQQSAEDTSDFIKGQLDDAKRNLDEQDAKLADFQRKYVGTLPGEEEANMNMLASLNTQLDAATQALARMEQDKSYEEAMLAQQVGNIDAPQQQKMTPQALQLELQKLQAQEAELKIRYTDDYPDVVAIRHKIQDLQKEVAHLPAVASAPAPSAPSKLEPVSVQQLRAQLRMQEQGIALKKHGQAQIQAQIALYQARIKAGPMVQEQFKEITRNYQTAQTFYDDLLTKMNQSKMATDLELRQQGEQFRVMDQPNLPEQPTYPKRGLFLGMGAFAGIAFGLLIVGILEYRDTSVRSERDIWAFTKLPTLVAIPLVTGKDSKASNRKPNAHKGRAKIENTGKPVMDVQG